MQKAEKLRKKPLASLEDITLFQAMSEAAHLRGKQFKEPVAHGGVLMNCTPKYSRRHLRDDRVGDCANASRTRLPVNRCELSKVLSIPNITKNDIPARGRAYHHPH